MESSKKLQPNDELAIQKFAEIIFKNITGPDGLPTKEGMEKMLAALQAAERDYDTHDLNLADKILREGTDLKLDKEFYEGLKGVHTIFTTFAVSTAVRAVTSSSRLKEFKSGNIDQNNYLEKLYQFLRSEGGLEVKSLKGYVLKHLFFANEFTDETKISFAYVYHNNKLDLVLLKQKVCDLIHPEVPRDLERKAVAMILSKLPSLDRKKCVEIIKPVIQLSRKQYASASSFNFAKDLYRAWNADLKDIDENNCFKELRKILKNEIIGKVNPTSLIGRLITNLFLTCVNIEESFLELAEESEKSADEKLSASEKELLKAKFETGDVDLEELRVRLLEGISGFKKLKKTEVEMKDSGSDESSKRMQSRK